MYLPAKNTLVSKILERRVGIGTVPVTGMPAYSMNGGNSTIQHGTVPYSTVLVLPRMRRYYLFNGDQFFDIWCAITGTVP